MEFLAAGRRGGVSVFERGAGAAGEKAGVRQGKAGVRQIKVSPAFFKRVAARDNPRLCRRRMSVRAAGE